METMDEKPLVHDAKTGGAEGITTEKLAPNESQIQTRTPGERLKNTGKKVLGDIKQAGKTAVEKTKDWYSGVKDKYNNAESTYKDPYLQRPEVNYRTSTVPSDEEERANQDIMKERLAETEDMIRRGAETGAEASAAMQNIKVPKSKLSSYQDIMNSEEYKGQRIPYMANAIGTNLANLLSGKDYKSYLKSHNEQMADTYAKNKAAVDTAATNANIQAIEAGNKAEMGKYVQMSDAMTEAALKRYGLLEDTENKRQMLESIINDATGLEGVKWGDLDADQKIAVMSLLQAYNGDYSMMSLAMEKYGDKFFDIIDQIGGKLGELLGMNKNNGGNGEPTETEENEIPENVPLVDGTTVPRENGKYVEIPREGEDPVYIKVDSTTPILKKEQIQQYVDALMNSSLSDEEKIRRAYLVDGWKDPEHAGLTGRQPPVTVKAVKSAISEKKKMSDLSDKITNSYGDLAALKSLEKEVKNSKNPEVQALYNQTVGAATVRKEMNDWKNDNSLTTNEKITLLENLADSEYGTYIANDPSLQDYIALELQGYKIRKDYNDPLLNQTNKYLAQTPDGKKAKNLEMKQNGNVVYGNKEYNLGSPEDIEKIDTEALTKVIDKLLLNNPNNVLATYNTQSNRTLSPKEAKEYFKQSSEYTAITKLLENQTLKNKAVAVDKKTKELINPKLKDKYDLLVQLYDKWD